MRCNFLLPAVLSFAACLPAQQTPSVVGSTVSGKVICADTSTPARFAKVLLKSTVPDRTGEDFMKQMEDAMKKAAAKSGDKAPPPTPEQTRTRDAAARNLTRATEMLSSSTVGLDGTFSFAGIKAGTYYVHAIFPGYIDPVTQFSDADFASTDPAMRARIAQLPTITLTGTDSAHMDLRLERGAAVSGRLTFDDGSPATGWMLTAVKPEATDDAADPATAMMQQALSLSGAAQIFKTDDLGHYRVSGLPAGTYALRATLVATPVGISAANIADGGSGISLTAFSGDTFSRAAAKTITLTSGEERVGLDISVPARTLHNIIGHASAKADGHTLNVGSVMLTSKTSPGLHLKAAIRDDGSFHFEYLPGGVTYTLTVEDAGDGRTTPSAPKFMGLNIPNVEVLHKYASDTTDVALADNDIDTVRFTLVQTDWVPPAKKPTNLTRPEDLFSPDKP